MHRLLCDPGGRSGLLVVGLLLLSFGRADAQEPNSQRALTDVQARLEQLERQNRQLARELERQRRAVHGQPGSGAVSEVSVRNIVDNYLSERELQEDGFQPVTNTPDLYGKFDKGWSLQSQNKAFTIKAGVEAQADVVGMSANPSVEQVGNGGVGPVESGTNIRRGRFDVKGTIYENFQYMMQYDLNLGQTIQQANGTRSVFNSPQPTEFWGMFKNLPFVRQVRIGNQKPLWSFENWTSSRFQNFMERSLAWDAFAEGQNNGFLPAICMLNWTENQRATFQLGIGRNNHTGYFYNTEDGDLMAEGRFSFLPWYCDERYFVHLGCGGMYADTSHNQVRFRSRTLLRNGSNQVQPIMTEARMFASNESRLVPELFINLDTWYIQAEYYMAWAGNIRTINSGVNGPSLGTWFGSGYYVQLMHFLTGEHHPYNRKMGRLERIVPNTNFFWMNSNGLRVFGSGCWLAGVRYSYVDLTDKGGVNGAGPGPSGAQPSSAKVYDISVALNWIVNPNARLVWDAIYEHRSAQNTPQSNGNLYGLGMRMMFDY